MTVFDALQRATTATLVFDRARLADNFAQLAAAARAHGITALFAMKAFPHAEAWDLARAHLDGFDVASAREAGAAAGARVVSIADPAAGPVHAIGGAARVIASCDTVEHVARAPRTAEIAIRLSASAGGRDPAIGAILDGSGHRRSRFGIDVDPDRRARAIAELRAAAAGRPVGLHVHAGAVTATSPARFVELAREALRTDFTPAFLNLGGAWHGLPDVAAAFAELRAAIPRAIEIIVEPGRLLAQGAGFATGRILHTRPLDDERRLCITELSRTCHLRWSPIERVGAPPAAGDGIATLFAGPTCFEDDLLGEWIVPPALPSRVVVRGVTGYAVAWNTGFGTIAPADVVFA